MKTSSSKELKHERGMSTSLAMPTGNSSKKTLTLSTLPSKPRTIVTQTVSGTAKGGD